MSLLNLTPPTVGQPNATEDVDIVNAFSTIQTWANGNVDEQNLATATNQRLGLNGSGTTGRGGNFIAATGTRSTATYGALNNGPDQVTVTLPTNGLLFVTFRAFWNSSVGNAGRAAIFLGANQLKIPQLNVPAGSLQQIATSGTVVNNWLFTWPGGLTSTDGGGTGVEGTDAVTTGLSVAGILSAGSFGGTAVIEAAAGSYAVSIQFLATSGTVTVTNRKLWVEAKTYS